MMNNAYAQYKTQSLSTMLQGELLVKLFDEMLKQCRIAELAIAKKDNAAVHESLMKTQTILSTLVTSLDDRYTISKELKSLYTFFAQELREANIKKDARKITGILPLIKDLRNSFEQADKISRTQKYAAVGG